MPDPKSDAFRAYLRGELTLPELKEVEAGKRAYTPKAAAVAPVPAAAAPPPTAPPPAAPPPAAAAPPAAPPAEERFTAGGRTQIDPRPRAEPEKAMEGLVQARTQEIVRQDGGSRADARAIAGQEVRDRYTGDVAPRQLSAWDAWVRSFKAQRLGDVPMQRPLSDQEIDLAIKAMKKEEGEVFLQAIRDGKKAEVAGILGQALLSRTVKRNGELIVVETPFAQTARIIGNFGGVVPLVQEAGFQRAEYTAAPNTAEFWLNVASAGLVTTVRQALGQKPEEALVTREERGRVRVNEEGEESLLVDAAHAAERGEGGLEFADAILRTQGVDPQDSYSPGEVLASIFDPMNLLTGGGAKLWDIIDDPNASDRMRKAAITAFRGAGLALDIIVPWEGAALAPLKAGKNVRSGLRMAELAPDAVKAEAKALVRGGDVTVDIAELAAKNVEQNVAAGAKPVLPKAIREDATRVLAGVDEARRTLDELEAVVFSKAAVAADKRLYREVVRETYLRAARREFGDDKLVRMTRRTTVAPAEVKAIRANVERILKVNGLDPAEVSKGISKRGYKLTPEQSRGLARLKQKLDVWAKRNTPSAPPTSSKMPIVSTIDEFDWNELVEQVTDASARLASDTRVANRRHRPIIDQLARWASVMPGMGKPLQRELAWGHAFGKMAGVLEGAGGKEADALLANLPASYRLVIETAVKDIGETAREVVDAISRAQKFGGQEALATKLYRHVYGRSVGTTVVDTETLDVMFEVEQMPWLQYGQKFEQGSGAQRVASVDFQQRVRDIARRAVGVADISVEEEVLKAWKTAPEDDLVVALAHWHVRQASKTVRQAKDIAESYFGIDIEIDFRTHQKLKFGQAPESYEALIAKGGKPKANAREVVRAFNDGDFNKLERLLGTLSESQLKAERWAAMYRLAVTWGVRRKLVELADELMDMGAAMRQRVVSGSDIERLFPEAEVLAGRIEQLQIDVDKDFVFKRIVEAKLKGEAGYYDATHMRWLIAAEVLDNRRANQWMELWGLHATDTAAAAFERPMRTVKFEGTTAGAVVPDFLANRLNEVAMRAKIPHRTFFESKPGLDLLNWSWRQYKALYTVGLLLPRAGYYVANTMSAPFQMWQQLGARRAVQAMWGGWGKNPIVVAELLKRMQGFFVFTPSSKSAAFVRADNGAVYSIDAVEDMARSYGLDSSFIRIENPRNLIEELRLMEPGELGSMERFLGELAGPVPATLGKVADGAAGFMGRTQELLFEVAHMQDMGFRMSVFVDGLQRGMHPDEAAALARDALFDYSKMTDWERSYMRLAFTFYSFMRANMTAFAKTAVRNPERISQPVRFHEQWRDLYHDNEGSFQEHDRNLERLLLYIGEAGELRTGEGDYRKSAFGIYGPILPVVDALKWAGAIAGVFAAVANQDIGDTGELANMIIGSANPVIALTVEGATNVEAFSGLEADRKSRRTVPGWLVAFDEAAAGGVLAKLFGIQQVVEDDPELAVDPSAVVLKRYEATGNGLVAWALARQFFFGPLLNQHEAIYRAMVAPRRGPGWFGEAMAIPFKMGAISTKYQAIEQARKELEYEIRAEKDKVDKRNKGR